MKDFRFMIFPHANDYVLFVDTIYLLPKYSDGFADLFYFHSEKKEPYFLQLTKNIKIDGVDMI